MIINLIKEANFEFDESKYKSVERDVFDMLVEPDEAQGDPAPESNVIVFNDKNEYKEKAHMYNLDDTRPIYINSKKQIFCFLKEK